MEIRINDPEDLSSQLEVLRPILDRYGIFLLFGEMGAGKTTLVTEILKMLGISEPEGSPTYALINSYPRTQKSVYHLDLYRLKKAAEAFDIGLEEILAECREGQAICFIEWPQIAEELIGDDAVSLHVEALEDGSRILAISFPESV